jgi:DNA-binding transcriptional ArsR family regulator
VNNQLDRCFDALSHPVRRTIVERLANRPATVGESARGLGISKPAVTKHVRVLEQAGLVRRRVEGRTHRLELEARALADVSRWLEFHRRVWEAKFDAVEEHLSDERRGA